MARRDEVENRVEVLLGLKAKGYGYNQMVEAGMRLWGVSDRQIKRYLQELKERERAMGNLSITDHSGRLLNQYRCLSAKAHQDGQFELARKLLRDEAKLIESLAKCSQRGGKSNDPLSHSGQLPPEEVAEIMAELEKDRLNP